MKSLRGHLLVASQQLTDQNFFRSVVLMISHDDSGAFGVILNRLTDSDTNDIWDQLTSQEEDDEQPAWSSPQPLDFDQAIPIHRGGPVEGPLLALHAEIDCSETEVLPGVYLTSRREHIVKLVEERRYPVRLFMGYSGWGPNQLEQELTAGGWLTVDAEFDDVFDSEDEIWERVVSQIGQGIMASVFDSVDIPDDPSVN